MAETGPAVGISLGADLLEAMGDLKGAAKAVGDDLKNVKTEAKQANKELSDAEKRAKKAREEIAKLEQKGRPVSQEQRENLKRLDAQVKDSTEKAFQAQRRADQQQARQAELKARAKAKAEQRRTVTQLTSQLDRGITNKLFRAEDQLQAISKKLADGGAISKAVGAQAGRLAGLAGAAGEGVFSAVGALGTALPLAVGGLMLSSRVYGEIQAGRRREADIGRLRGQRAEITRDFFAGIGGQTLSTEFLQSITEEQAKRATRARADIGRRSVFGETDVVRSIYDFIEGAGSKVGLGFDFGATGRELEVAKRQTERQKLEDSLRAGAAKFGESFTKNIGFDVLEDSDAADTAWNNFLAGSAGKRYLAKMSDAMAGEAQFKQDWAAKIQASTIAGEEKKRANIQTRFLQDPVRVAETHLRATRWQGIEKQRQRNAMDAQKF